MSSRAAPSGEAVLGSAAGQSPSAAQASSIIISANSFWNISNFRQSLVEALVAAGYQVSLAAPGADHCWAARFGAEAIDLDVDRSCLLRWIRSPFLESDYDHGKVVVHGHTISRRIDERHNRIGIDTGAYRSGVLAAICLEGEDRRPLRVELTVARETAEA